METITELVGRAVGAGLALRPIEPDRLRVTGPDAAAEYAKAVLARKAEVLAFLREVLGHDSPAAAADAWPWPLEDWRGNVAKDARPHRPDNGAAWSAELGRAAAAKWPNGVPRGPGHWGAPTLVCQGPSLTDRKD